MKIIFTILFCYSFAISNATNYHPSPSEGGGFYSTTPPYDTIYLDNTYTWTTFDITHWHGTSYDHPIVILPYGGDVLIGNSTVITTASFGCTWTDCWYIKMEGKNNWGSSYGFIVESVPRNIATLSTFGFSLDFYKVIRLDSILIANNSMGIHDGLDPGCRPSQNYPNWVNDSLFVWKCKVVRTWNQGMYFGNTNPDNYPPPQAAHPGFLPRPVSCNNISPGSISAVFSASAHTITISGNYADSFLTTSYFGITGSVSNNGDYWYNTSNATFGGGVTTIHCLNDGGAIVNETATVTIRRITYPEPARLGMHSIMYNIVDSTGRSGIQLASASSGTSEIGYNTISHTGLNGDAGQGTDIYIGSYTQFNAHDNICGASLYWGFAVLGASGSQYQIVNNQIQSAAAQDPFTFPGTWPIGFVYNYDTMHTTPNPYTVLMYPLYIDTRLEKYTDSSSFYISGNQIGLGIGGLNGIAIGDEQNTFKKAPNSNYICNNTAYGVAPDPPPITELFGAVVPYSTSCSSSSPSGILRAKKFGYRIIRN